MSGQGMATYCRRSSSCHNTYKIYESAQSACPASQRLTYAPYRTPQETLSKQTDTAVQSALDVYEGAAGAGVMLLTAL